MGRGQPSCTARGIGERCKLLPEANAVCIEKKSPKTMQNVVVGRLF